jgi:hypothetical protein
MHQMNSIKSLADSQESFQRLDIGFNRPFKSDVANYFTQWMIRSGNGQPTRQDAAKSDQQFLVWSTTSKILVKKLNWL